MQAMLTQAAGARLSKRRRLEVLAEVRPDPRRVAVLLNKNARKVSDLLARTLGSVVGKGNLFYSRTLEEAEGYAREVVQRGYGTVVCGGGDGTLARSVNLVQRYVDEANYWRYERHRRFGEHQSLLQAPRFAFLSLGTGNGIARVVGARDAVRDLERIVADDGVSARQVPLVEVDGERCFFLGLGYDSLLLNHYNWLKARTQSPLCRPMMHSVMGYFAALLTRTLPAVISGRASSLDVRIISRGEGWYVNARAGDLVEAIESDRVLFEGRATFVGAGTTPFFGYGFKIFPFAGMQPGMMNLRIAALSAFTALSHLPSLWNGAYRNPSQVFDFLVNDIEIELVQPYPFQHSGDAQGMRKNLRWRIADEPMEIVDLHRPAKNP